MVKQQVPSQSTSLYSPQLSPLPHGPSIPLRPAPIYSPKTSPLRRRSAGDFSPRRSSEVSPRKSSATTITEFSPQRTSKFSLRKSSAPTTADRRSSEFSPPSALPHSSHSYEILDILPDRRDYDILECPEPAESQRHCYEIMEHADETRNAQCKNPDYHVLEPTTSTCTVVCHDEYATVNKEKSGRKR